MNHRPTIQILRGLRPPNYAGEHYYVIYHQLDWDGNPYLLFKHGRCPSVATSPSYKIRWNRAPNRNATFNELVYQTLGARNLELIPVTQDFVEKLSYPVWVNVENVTVLNEVKKE